MSATVLRNKLRQIFLEEGFLSFSSRIIRLGRYRLAIKKILNSNDLAANQVSIAGCLLDLPRRRGGIVEELLLYGVHEPSASHEYASRLRPGMRALEVGTNLGYYLAVASSKVGSEGEIIGFEPDPELFELASGNASRLNTPTRVLPFAASDHNGTSNFYQSAVGNWGSLKKEEALQQTGAVDVQTRTIDDFCEETDFKPDALRMDIEGAEAMALSGARCVIEKNKPILFIEIHKFLLTEIECRTILSVLRNGGYKNVTVIDRYYDWPWSLESARKAAVSEMGIDEFEVYFMSPSCSKVFSVIASA